MITRKGQAMKPGPMCSHLEQEVFGRLCKPSSHLCMYEVGMVLADFLLPVGLWI